LFTYGLYRIFNATTIEKFTWQNFPLNVTYKITK
jgi:hypothetical protein